MTTYYVDNVLGNDANDGISAGLGAVETMQRGVTLLTSPGDILSVSSAAGNYTDSFEISAAQGCVSGTKANPMTIQLSNVLTHSGLCTITDISHWTLSGLDFRAGITLGSITNRVINSYADNIILTGGYSRHQTARISLLACRDCTIQSWEFDNLRSRTAGTDYAALRLFSHVTGLLVDSCIFSDIGSDGIHIDANSNLQPFDMSEVVIDDITISNNIFKVNDPYQYRDITGANATAPTVPPDTFDGTWVGENGIDIKVGTNITISGNSFSGFRDDVANQDLSGSQGTAIVLHDYIGNAFEDNGYSIIVTRNDFWDNQTAISIGAHESDAPRQGYLGILIKNNRFRDNRRSPVGRSFNLDSHLYSHFIVNNALSREILLYHNSYDSVDDDTRNSLSIAAGTVGSSRNECFSNCSMVISTGFDGNYSAGEVGTVSWDADWGSHIIEDNLLLDTDLKPRNQNSPLFKAGTNLHVEDSFDGTTRKEIPDIGCYEQPLPVLISMGSNIVDQ